MDLEVRYTLPNQNPRTVPVRDRILIGTLMSNEIVIRAPGVEPIHAMIEALDDGGYAITDLGSQDGVQLNGRKIEVEAKISVGDVISIASIKLDVLALGASSNDNFHTATTETGNFSLVDYKPEAQAKTDISSRSRQELPKTDVKSNQSDFGWNDKSKLVSETISTPKTERQDSSSKKNMLFSPKTAKPSGDVLEVVSYWQDTVLDVELFHPNFKGNDQCFIGTPPHAHLLAGGKSDIKAHRFVDVAGSGFKIRMLDDMHARLRKSGKLSEKKGSGSVSLGRKDVAQVAHGPIKYFLMFVKPPSLILPKSGQKDMFLFMSTILALVFYGLMLPLIYMSDGVQEEDNQDDIWSVVNVPEKIKKPKPVPKPKPPKPKQKVAEAPKPKVPPKPPKPKPEPPKPAPPKVKPPPKVVKKVKPKPVTKPNKSLANKKAPTKRPAKSPAAGMVKTGAKKPDKKLPGRRVPGRKLGLSGGPRGGGKLNPRGGGRRKGTSKNDLKGVEGGAKGKASGVNLSKLGLGVGKVFNKAGPGAIKTNFNSSAGGAGGGSGSASKTYGLGGPGKGQTLSVSGTGGAAKNFGSGFGGNGSGQGGSGGLGGAGLRSGFGRGRGSGGRANVVVPATDPVIAGGLTTQEVQAVIRANLNQIRHCYEQLLQRSPSSQGKVKVKFVVQPNGRVGSAKITQSDIRDMVMRGCVTGKVKRWKFPSPRGGKAVSVNYPFVFNPL